MKNTPHLVRFVTTLIERVQATRTYAATAIVSTIAVTGYLAFTAIGPVVGFLTTGPVGEKIMQLTEHAGWLTPIVGLIAAAATVAITAKRIRRSRTVTRLVGHLNRIVTWRTAHRPLGGGHVPSAARPRRPRRSPGARRPNRRNRGQRRG